MEMMQLKTTKHSLFSVGSFFSGSLGDRYHAPTIVGVGLIGSGLSILFLAVGFWTNFIAFDLAASRLFFLVSTVYDFSADCNDMLLLIVV